MKLKKILLFGALGLVLLGLIGVLLVALCLDGIVKRAVETVGPRLTQVSITLDTIHIGVMSGSVKLKGLVVGNPSGYESSNAVSVGLAEISADVASALSDKIIIHTIHLESPEITLEGGFTKNNLFQIRDNLNSLTQSTGPTGTNVQTTASGKPVKKLEVDDFLITGGQVHVRLNGMAGLAGQELTVPLPDIHLQDLGKGPDGITPAELTRLVFNEVTSKTLAAATGSLSHLGKGATDSVKKITSGLGGLLK
jgi:hypothetical protein